MNLFKYEIKTNKEQEFIDINDLLYKSILDSNVENGIAIIYCPHTTAGITINENADPDVITDIIASLNKKFPIIDDYKHFEGNSHSHLKSSYMGVEKTIIVANKKAILGTWQSVFFCDFDGPRKRQLYIKVIEC